MSPVLQTVTASQNGSLLPASTGQIVEQSVADQVIAANRGYAPRFGYTVNGDGSFTDPVSGITLLQGYVPAAPFFDVPVHPFCGAPPPKPDPIAPGAWDAHTALVCAWGQSECGNFGRSRYSAVNANAWVYGGGGQFFPCADPIVGCDGSDGSVWSRCADAAIGRPFNGGVVTKFVLRNFSVGGTSINDWAPGGNLNDGLVSGVIDFMTRVGMPTHLVYSQGETDIVHMTAQQWTDQWFAMLNSLRQMGCTAKIWTSIETICNYRDVSDPSDPSVINATPNTYIKTEVGRLAIRAAQIAVGNVNQNTLQGPNLDLIDWRLRAYGDGCHFGELGLTAAGQAWAAALFPEA